MKSSSARTVAVVLLVILLIVPLSTRLTAAQSAAVTTATLVLLGPPILGASCGPLPCVTATYHNVASLTLSTYMWVSVMNSQGQTIGVFLGSATIAGGQNATINAALLNVRGGNYSASVFATTINGIVLSTTSTLSFALT